MKKSHKVIFVIPVYNEAEILEKVVDDIINEIKDIDFKVLLINDGSSDNSLEKIKKIKKKYNQKIEYIDQENIGHGPTLFKGYSYAVENYFDYIFQIDSDNQFLISDFSKLWEYKDKYKLVIGFRKNRKDTILRIILTKIVRFLILILFFVKIKDSNCPFRLIHKDLLVECIKLIESETLIPNIFISVIAAKKKTLFFREISHMDRKTGKVSIVNAKLLFFCLKSLVQILNFRLKI